VKPALGDVLLAALTRDQVQTFLAESPLVRNSRVMMRSIIGAALNDAVDEGLTRGLIFPLHPRSATNAWVKLVKQAGLRHMKLHGLRHMHATTLLSAGVPVTVVSKRLGHANVSMTLDTYSHVIPGQDEAAADVMGSAFA
jgi:integrase